MRCRSPRARSSRNSSGCREQPCRVCARVPFGSAHGRAPRPRRDQREPIKIRDVAHAPEIQRSWRRRHLPSLFRRENDEPKFMKRRGVLWVGPSRGLPTQGVSKMRSILLASAALLVLAPAATMAQSPNSAPQPNVTQNEKAGSATAEPQHIRANLRNALEKAGYKDIRVAPTSFMVHAKDADGNPVVMSISPDSFTEVADMTNNNNSNAPSTTGA